MLVLSRKEGEKIVVGNDIVITVVEIGRGRVKIGIQAPRTMGVDRSEVRANRDDERRRGEHGTIPQ